MHPLQAEEIPTVCALLGRLPEYQGQAVFAEQSVVVPYKNLPEAAFGVADTLAQHGVQPGDVVGVLAPTTPEFLTGFLGILAAGGAASVLPTPTVGTDLPQKLEPLVRSAQMRHLVVAEPFGDCARALAASTGVQVVPVEGCAPATTPPAAGAVSATAAAVVQFTSGSAAHPKGAVLSHGAVMAAVQDVLEFCEITSQDRFALWLPLFHDFGLFELLYAMTADADIHLFSPLSFIRDPAGLLSNLSENELTIFAAPNFAYDRLILAAGDTDGHGLDLSRWRMAWNGGEVIRPDTLTRFAETFGPLGVEETVLHPAYGMAETSLAVTGVPSQCSPRVLSVERDSLTDGQQVRLAEHGAGRRRLVSCGVPLGRAELRITDGADNVLEEGRFGEIETRGPGLMTGYLHHREATDEAFHDDWLRTGDTGFMWDGELYVAGRTKDMIIAEGRNLHAEDVEALAAKVPGVFRQHCVAVADVQAERLTVVVETTEADLQAVAERARMTVSAQLGLSRLTVHPVRRGWLPRTTSGKWRRPEVRQRLKEMNHE
ncbi:AMP-binding protein [Streptomyces sp. NPDC055239]